jgi:hypothetical protein
MRFNELRGYFEKYHLEEMTRVELTAAIALWQRAGALQ